jgi:hypothetical protein
VIILADAGGTEMRCTHRPGTVELVFGGDTECETMIDALEFASKTLREMQADNQRGIRTGD